MNWQQQPETIEPVKKDKTLLVNNRGRVISIDKDEAATLLGDGRFYAPPDGSKEGDYIPVYDQGLNANSLTAKLPTISNDGDIGDWLPVIKV